MSIYDDIALEDKAILQLFNDNGINSSALLSKAKEILFSDYIPEKNK